ncbi:MAG: phosphonate ABC transporter, permease protein PhnE [Bradymonadaceae bacterium]
MTRVVRVQNLHVSFPDGAGRVHALRGIDFEIEEGERVAIIGSSGSGKSTLMRVLSGLIPATEGVVSVAGHSLEPKETPSREIYRDVGLVFQNYGLVPQLSAVENVLCGRFAHQKAFGSFLKFDREERDKAEAILDELGLTHRANTRCSRLSGGEQQRVALARLLFQNPSLMLLDEPISSLDVHWAHRLTERFIEAVAERGTLVMVHHDLGIVREYADRVLLIRDGELVFDGAPDEGCRLLEDFQGPGPDGSLEGVSPPPLVGHPPPALPALSAVQKPVGGPLSRGAFYGLIIAAIAILYVWAAAGVDFSASRIFGNVDNATNFMGRMFPPDFSVSKTILGSLVETIQMALIGTTLAAFVALPIAVLAARNLSPRPLQMGARLVLNFLRTIPSIIWGLFFVAIVGLGPFPGILALTFYAAGYLGKFYYEGIESIDPRPLIALKTVGASPVQRFRFGVFPQVLPLLLSYTLYMFEYNVRAASILGVVGAGGVGFYLYSYINNFHYHKAATALFFLLVVVTIIDAVSSRVRARLVE